MMIAARNAFLMSGGKPTARDYVQDGLIAMWDGLENAGWGAHDSTAATWVDLTGNEYDLTVNSAVAAFTADGLNVHTVPTSSSLHRAAYNNSKDLPALDNMEFECVFKVDRDYSDDFNWYFLVGGGLSTVDSSRSRNVGLVQYVTAYNRHFCASTTSVKMLPYNNTETILRRGTHYYSSGEARSRPLFDGVIVEGGSAFDAYPLTDHGYHLTVGGMRYSTYSVNSLAEGVSLCALRCYARSSGYLTMAERLANYAIDAARFGL